MRLRVVGFALLVAACGDNQAVAPELVATATEPPGANCANGGIAIETGRDTNGNGMLDGDEVTQTK
ncbi:MAG: hypothetical protein ACM31C_01960 [Acidobacteriota bacterium]